MKKVSFVYFVLVFQVLTASCGDKDYSKIIGSWSLCHIGELSFNECPIVLFNRNSGTIEFADMTSCEFNYSISGSQFDVSDSYCSQSYLANGSYEYQLDVKNEKDFSLRLISKSDTFYLSRSMR